MSKITFSEEHIKLLEQNPYVKRVSSKSITYTDEFKRLFIEEYLKGQLPRTIFQNAEFDIQIIGIKRYEQAAARWIKAYNKDGIIGLRDTRSENSGRSSNKPLPNEQIIIEQQNRIKLLEDQLELLKKLDTTERRLVNNYVNLSNSEIYKLIYVTVSDPNYKGTVSFCCLILSVSRSSYYNYLKQIPYHNRQEQSDLEAKENILLAMDYRGYKKGSRSIKMV